MRWWCGLFALVLVWIGYALSPYVALYRLSEAVRTGDARAVADRVNFRTLRLSISRQAVAAGLDAVAARRDLSPRERQMLTDAVTGLTEPVVTALLMPETLVALLRGSWPRQLDGEQPEGEAADPVRTGGLSGRTLPQLLKLAGTAEMRGFRTVIFGYPPDAPEENRFRLRLRLRGWTWRVTELELPAELRERISRQLLRAQRRTETRRVR
ncbi:DUF2939 domain-containing protein [Methylobacterium isbiliense]|jgi:hypothetical protein|uniref:DUF2939 domain-containing protein n=1 Tax=Methylobacterium isbiliense TaxID=315478 RepID=A0ABQ4SF38_9HYPH|nr:DUF2939 domain-containing protein [Methylobacterium isbiliense]MDN3626212.1 DUF2939 domain-containing protein [Methylobacterium isbiliense]GJE00991.1 hypothetical protein GMJLKIPL_2919 [Methylobacterium isbiliense]